jgi:hypothetical protein
MSHLRARSVMAAVAVAVVLFALAAPVAGAHPLGGNNSDAAHYLTRIEAVSPGVPGLTAAVSPRGEWIEVTNTTGRTLIVLGYAHEPYLRVTPAGVAQNGVSPTVVLNQNLFADISQALLSAPQPPQWQAVSTANHVRWHDHRIHWMGAARPPGVQAHPGTGQLIGRWTVHMTLDAQPVDITGTLSWLPKKSGIDKSLLFLVGDALLLGAAVAGFAIYGRRRRIRAAAQQPPPTPEPDPRPGEVDPLDDLELSALAARRQDPSPSNNGGDRSTGAIHPPRM